MYLKPRYIPYDIHGMYLNPKSDNPCQIKDTIQCSSFFNIYKEMATFGLLAHTSMVHWPCFIFLLPLLPLCMNFSFELWSIVLVFCTFFASMSRVAVIFPLRLRVKFTPRTPGVRAFQVIQAEEDVWRRFWLLAQVTVGKVSHWQLCRFPNLCFWNVSGNQTKHKYKHGSKHTNSFHLMTKFKSYHFQN